MLSRLTRIFLALVTAFVFTGQMEAAAQHCARLANAVVVETAAPPCHESSASAKDAHATMDHHAQPAHHTPSPPDHSSHAPAQSKAPPHCECIAALTGWTGSMGATVSAHVESYAWLTPTEAPFASAKADPDFRPPRLI